MLEAWKYIVEIIWREYFEAYQRKRDHYLFHLAPAVYLRNDPIYKKALVFFLIISVSTLVWMFLINNADVTRTVIGRKSEYSRQIPIALL